MFANWSRRAAGIVAAVFVAALLAACADQQRVDLQVPEQGNPNYFEVRDAMADEIFVTDDASRREWFDGIRRIYIAPLDLENMQVIQPPNARIDERWPVDDVEKSVVEKTFVREMTRAMEADQAFHIVATPGEAQAFMYARVVAVYPYFTPAEAETEGGRGAVTMTFALVDPSDETVVIRALDSKSTDDVRALDEIRDDRDAIDRLFESWGYQIRRSLLFLQARLDAVQVPILVSPQ